MIGNTRTTIRTTFKNIANSIGNGGGGSSFSGGGGSAGGSSGGGFR